MKKDRDRRRISKSSGNPRAYHRLRKIGGRATFRLPPKDFFRAVFENFANPLPRLKPNEPNAWILAGVTSNGHAPYSIPDWKRLAELLTEFELSKSEQREVMRLVVKEKKQARASSAKK